MEIVASLSVLPLLILSITGATVGAIGGLLGIGGGVVVVPVLLELFAAQHLPSAVSTPLSIGTAHAAVLLASISAAVAHANAGRIDRTLVRTWFLPLLLGTVIGLGGAFLVAPTFLMGLFAAVALFLGMTLLAGDRVTLPGPGASGIAPALPPLLVGTLASALGIGGGTLSGPALALLSTPLHRAIGAGTVFNIIVAIPSTAMFMWSGWRAGGLPRGSIGYVSIAPLIALTLPALLVAPYAARLAPHVPVAVLRRLFALCLLVIALRMAMQILPS